MEQVQAALVKVEASLKDRISDHNTSITLLTNQLKEAIGERDSARSELRKHEETVQASSSSQQEHLYAQIQVTMLISMVLYFRSVVIFRYQEMFMSK